jgi:hypothetical protein
VLTVQPVAIGGRFTPMGVEDIGHTMIQVRKIDRISAMLSVKIVNEIRYIQDYIPHFQ